MPVHTLFHHSSFILILSAHAQGTAFTYQGRLNDGANPANGTYHLRFALFDALTFGNQVGSSFANSPVTVSNGRSVYRLTARPGWR